eukprot:8411514-Karenia_brevis.AAC.1
MKWVSAPAFSLAKSIRESLGNTILSGGKSPDITPSKSDILAPPEIEKFPNPSQPENFGKPKIMLGSTNFAQNK